MKKKMKLWYCSSSSKMNGMKVLHANSIILGTRKLWGIFPTKGPSINDVSNWEGGRSLHQEILWWQSTPLVACKHFPIDAVLSWKRMAIINSSLACSGALPVKRTGICALHQRPKKGSFTNYMSSLISLTFRDSPRCCGQVYLQAYYIVTNS